MNSWDSQEAQQRAAKRIEKIMSNRSDLTPQMIEAFDEIGSSVVQYILTISPEIPVITRSPGPPECFGYSKVTAREV